MLDPADAVAKIGDVAAASGIRRVHLLSWRDLADVEAGGSEVHASHIARLWAAAGIEVTWRTSYAQGQAPVVARDGYRVIRRAGRYLVFPRAIGSELLGRHGSSDALVEIWNGMPFFSPLWYPGPKVVVLHHVHAEMWQMVLGDDAPWMAAVGDTIERRVAPLVYRRARVVTLSQSSKDDIVELLGFHPSRVDVAPPGIDPMFTPGAAPSPVPLVVAVGRLVPVKRYDLLLRAVARARERVHGTRLAIVGDGYERPGLDEVVRGLDAAEWVTFTGRLTDAELVDMYRRAWVIASASAREGWGMALTEAAACGTPAVATRIAGHLDAVVDGTSGILTAATPDDLGGALATVLGDAELRAQLGEGALAHAGRFSWEETATGIMRVLADEAQRRRH